MYIHTIPRRGVREGEMKADKKKIKDCKRTDGRDSSNDGGGPVLY